MVRYIGHEIWRHTLGSNFKMSSWSQNVNMLIMCIYCAWASPLSKSTLSLQSGRSIERNTTNMTWRGTIQSDMTRGDEENTYGFLTIPSAIPATYLNVHYIPALTVTDRKAKRYLRSCTHQQYPGSTWNAVSLQIDLYPLSACTPHSPAFTSDSASRGQQSISPEPLRPSQRPRDASQAIRRSSNWRLLR